MRAAWEWRGFWAAEEDAGLRELAVGLGGRLGAVVPAEVVAEDDTYLVLPDLRHNLKVRRGRLELKVLLQSLPDGFSLWQDKQVWRFPLDLEQMAAVLERLPDHYEAPVMPFDSPRGLFEYLQQQDPRLAIVPVAKQRIRLRSGGSRLELAQVELSRGLQLMSACVDGYELDAVRALVRRSHLAARARSLSYVELLQETAWRFPQVRGANEAKAA
jgi:hypothetical protein